MMQLMFLDMLNYLFIFAVFWINMSVAFYPYFRNAPAGDDELDGYSLAYLMVNLFLWMLGEFDFETVQDLPLPEARA